MFQGGLPAPLCGDPEEPEVQPAGQLPPEGGERHRGLHPAQRDLSPALWLALQLPEVHPGPGGEHHEEGGPQV